MARAQKAAGAIAAFQADSSMHPCRLDRFLAQRLPDYSRTYIQRLIEQGYVTLNTMSATKASITVLPQMIVTVTMPEQPLHEPVITEASLTIPVDIIFRHEQFLIIHKPAGLVVHQPLTTTTHITLVDWLKHHVPEAAAVGDVNRPGIVHRLDKDTSGLMIIATDPRAHHIFSACFKDRTIKKRYLALVTGHPPLEGSIDFSIDRHPTERTRMTHSYGAGRSALTRYRVIEYLADAALVEAFPETGRTHQIRVHFAAIGHPIIGDATYGSKSKLIVRHALHAAGLTFTYGDTPYSFTSELPQDMCEAYRALKLALKSES